MDINKALKKQRKSYRNFVLFMSIIFLLLPIFLVISKIYNVFFIVYLLIIEFLIIMSILVKTSLEGLHFKHDAYRIRIKQGIFKEENSIMCKNVYLVCTEKGRQLFDIIIVCDSKFRNKNMRRVSKMFIEKHEHLAKQYEKLKKDNPEKDFYYIFVRRGIYKKYQLLDIIYSTCVGAVYTEDTIEKIKEYRNQIKKE